MVFANFIELMSVNNQYYLYLNGFYLQCASSCKAKLSISVIILTTNHDS